MSNEKSFWPLWVLLTTIGYAVGMGLDQALYSTTSTALSGVAAGLGSVALYGAIAGAFSGALQALLLRGRIERPLLWVLASMAGGAVGFMLGTVTSEVASNAIGIHLDVYTTGAIIQIVFGAFSGAGIGLAQWLLIRGKIQNAAVWVPANIFGLTLGFSIPVGVMQLVSLTFLPVWLGAFGGLALGLIQWLWARRIFVMRNAQNGLVKRET
jgi:hypothetical protein